MKLPLKDGDKFQDNKGRNQTVGGSIKKSLWNDEENEGYCWTTRGDWFRRSDGVEVTGAYLDEDKNPVTIEEAFKIRGESFAG